MLFIGTSNNECLLKWLLVIEEIGYYHTYALKNTLFQIERVPDFTLNVHTYIGSTYLFGIHQTFSKHEQGLYNNMHLLFI